MIRRKRKLTKTLVKRSHATPPAPKKLKKSRRTAYSILSSIVLIAVGIIFLSSGTYYGIKSYSANILDKRLKMAVQHSIRMERPDGSFQYLYDYKKNTFSFDNNIVRQAGGSFGLSEYYAATHDPDVEKRLQTSISTLQKWSVGDTQKRLVAGPHEKDTPLAGSSALALLAVLFYQDTSGDHTFDLFRDQLKNGLCALLIPGQGIAKTPGSKSQSPYFDGETWLALAHYNRLFPKDKTVVDTLAKLEPYLMAHYRDNFDGAFFHWGAMASSKRYETTNDPTYLDFALNQLKQFNPNRERVMCFAIEGIGGIALSLPENDTRRIELTNIIKNGMENFTLHRQFLSTTFDDGTPMATGAKHYLGGFQNLKYTTRIDDTQHCISAMLKAKKLGISPKPISKKAYLAKQAERAETRLRNPSKMTSRRYSSSLQQISRDAIIYALKHKKEMPVDIKKYKTDVLDKTATYLILRHNGQVISTQGHPDPKDTLVHAVVKNATLAALDPSHPTLTPADLNNLSVTVLVLSPKSEIHAYDDADLIALLRPGIDGIAIINEKKRAILLPDAWTEFPDKAEFLNRVKAKAGLRGSDFPETVKFFRFTARETN